MMENKIHKCVGLIIKNRSVSVVEVEARKNLPVITNYSKIYLEEGIVENDCVILNKEAFQEAVKKLLETGVGGAIKTHTIYISLPEEKIFSHQISVLKEKAEDVEYIKQVAEDYIPIELSQAVFDFKVVHEDPNGKTVTINVVATQSSIAQPLIDVLAEISLEVVAINVDVYCLIKSFYNCLNQGEGGFLLVNMEPSRDILAVVTPDNQVFKRVVKHSENDITAKLKALMNLSTDEELKQMLIATRRNQGMTEEQKKLNQEAFREYFEDMSGKLRQLIDSTQWETKIEIKRIYLTGLLSAMPGTEEVLTSLLPEVPVMRTVQYLEIPLEIEEDALEGIGLCMNGCLTDEKNNFNLLPERRRDEMTFAKVGPRFKMGAVALALLMILLTVRAGLSASASYLNYRMTSREIVILNEQALNPYITEQARTKQALKQSRNQILLLLQDSFQVSRLITDLDTYNQDGVNLVSFNFRDMNSAANAEVSLKAKTLNRATTEKLIGDLQQSGRYEKVISPLSNLVGKGERFVNISLEIDKTKAIGSDEEEPETNSLETEENNAPKIPQ